MMKVFVRQFAVTIVTEDLDEAVLEDLAERVTGMECIAQGITDLRLTSVVSIPDMPKGKHTEAWLERHIEPLIQR